MLFHKLVFAFLSSICLFSAQAYDAKDGNITAVVGPFIYKTNFSDNPTGASASRHGDLALLVGGDINSYSSLEISMMYMHKQYFRDNAMLKSIVTESQLMHIAMGYRYWINPYLSTALGFYSAYPMDETRVVHTDFAPGSNITTSADDRTEYGFDFSVQSELWGNDFMSLVADARYALSITSQSSEKSDHYGLMLGLKFLAQSKNKN
jgi:hypothetical protein